MDKEDKQIIDRATKENWRIGDRTRLKHLLKKNLKLYRENVELENKIADIKANCDLAIEGRDVKIMELEKENEMLKGDLELWESGGCRATNLFECGVVKDLREQIEKMKCCANCDHYRWSNGDDWCNAHLGQPMYDEECKGKWKLKE